MASPFDLADDTAYRAWRDARLAAYPRNVDELVVPLADPRQPTAAEFAALEDRCARANMAIYSAPHRHAADKSIPKRLAQQLGLARLEGNYLADEDGLSSITPADDESSGVRGDFIPYTHKPINWHTDGYYNALDRRILGMTLHCAQDAESGENALLDHEIAYIQLRDVNPDYVAALMQPDAMTIPARMDEDNVARAEQSGPVFSVDPDAGFLVMRYTARTRSIVWKADAVTQAAVKTLADILVNSEYILAARLAPGMGLLCNNVLHTRSGFTDSPDRRRLLYRGRYYDRLSFPARAA